jgi:hypothetical protein
MHQTKFPSRGRLIPVLLALVALGARSLVAEDAFVTGCIGSAMNGCPPSCADKLGTSQLHTSASAALPQGDGRSKTMFGVTNTASWAVTPRLGTSSGAYRVYVSMGTTNECSTNIIVKIVATSGCTLADTNFVGQSEVLTAAFQRWASLNVWTPVAIISNSVTQPTILFSYVSGESNRWYMDEVRFENILAGPTSPARITEVLYGHPATISGTGPIGHPFALVSSTNAAKGINQWTSEQTNSAGTGSFSFSVTPGAERARFFRVITQ